MNPVNDWWVKRLMELYDAARDRKGQSLSIYSEVLTLIDYLEGINPIPKGFDVISEADKLCARLRSI